MIEFPKDWHDFEIIAAGNGEKLERWGDIVLLRPDPQAVWDADFDFSGYPDLAGRYIRSSSGGGAWSWYKKISDEWTIGWRDMKFIISPMNFKHTGLFPEQAVNWDKMQKIIRAADKPKILNLFAYTGGATAACGKAGAAVTHVDASRGMTDVAKQNCKLNGIPFENTRFIVDDVKKFVEREIRRGNRYDAVIMDPPNFGRGANGEVWKLEDDLNALVKKCCELLCDKPLFFLINNYTASVQPAVIANVLWKALNGGSFHERVFGGRGGHYNMDCYEIGLPVRGEVCALPCGCSVFAAFKEGK